ncbi:MAG TPA: NAD(P)(+) transhydrogenase (Re/Si-specific) subunit beta [Pirellulaceae bacterium]|nr:NAD(P)(+) transhydrogenase (Re/Si-specific) subunit beta [Pirellulaceae bacterium]HMO92903.1 NAD(P)(+) transhydrogenase (Re/Si-specific) subunit beta [Pirellulaceae bacterium]HMP69181.1 NAD(P)(+) transhydrogenase (Re/Si-specific) subunit beta [Pirellulaceae bacterium]
MNESLFLIICLVAAICFIFSLGGLSKHESARRGNLFGIVGITIAVSATLVALFYRWQEVQDANEKSIMLTFLVLTLAAIGVGSAIGAVVARKVDMKAMPQLVAILHSFVGIAAVIVGIASHVEKHEFTTQMDQLIHEIEVFLGVFIGGITFTGSVVAWGKLQEVIGSSPYMLPGRHLLNLGMVVTCVLLGVWFLFAGSLSLIPLLIMTAISFVIGFHLVMAIGGADMPVVVSMLNSYSGWAAAAIGFLIPSDLLIVTGALVGSSGAILSYIMCSAMNRSFISVILGGFGTDSGKPAADGQQSRENLTWNEILADETAQSLVNARRVIIVPGYGMAVAQAQHPVYEITKALKDRGVETRFAIHPVAGRLPGHMNVLLAEAKVPYDYVLEMEEINDDFPETDVVLIIGANDIVNPSAMDDPSSPIYGMPVLQAWKAAQVVVLKRSMATGYSGIDNPLFYKDNTYMLFGDAKSSVDNILAHLRNGSM